MTESRGLVVFSSWLGLLWCVAGSAAPTVVGEEDVPVYLDDVKNIVCRDRVPDHGFGPVPANVQIGTQHLFDRTLRIESAGSVYSDLPQTVTCADLKAQLAATPQALTAHRKVERLVEDTLDGKRTVSRLVATITLKVGNNLVLHGEQGWLEQNAPLGNLHPGFPIVSHFVVLAYPQSATDTVGLACKPAYEGAEQTWLTLGNFSGYSDLGWMQSNSDRLRLSTEKPAACEDLKSALLEAYTAEDPGNWGTPLKVERKVELTHRYLLDNQANQACQEIELETVSADVRGNTFRAAASFPLRTVPLKDCLPTRK